MQLVLDVLGLADSGRLYVYGCEKVTVYGLGGLTVLCSYAAGFQDLVPEAFQLPSRMEEARFMTKTYNIEAP